MWKKVIAPTLLVCLLWLSVSGATTYCIHWLSRARNQILAENVPTIRAAGSMQASLWKLQAAFLDAIEDDAPPAGASFDELEAQFERSLVAAEQALERQDERALVVAIRQRYSAYRDFIHNSLRTVAADRSTAASTGDRSAELARNVAVPCTELLELNERLMTESVARSTRLENILTPVRLAFLIGGPILGIYLGLRMARNLHQSISRISVTLKDASGELDDEVGRVDISPDGDLGDLTRLNQQVQAISTRIRQVVSELQKARQEAERSERLAMVGELAAGVAHELRNPLTSVKLLIQTARREQPRLHLPEKQVQVIMQEISRMEETIQSLLDFARPPELNRVVHDLRDTLRRALNLIDGRAAHEGIAVVPQLPESPLMLDGDPDQLHQVFVNLLINGIESMDFDGTLHVAAARSQDHPEVCLVTVADGGGGIPVEQLGRIFDPFVTTKERGTGLGLAVSRRIVEEHGGRITACNRPEGGALFTVELPLTVSTVRASAVQSARAVPPPQYDTVATAGSRP